MLRWDRQRNLEWRGTLRDKAFEGREMATTPGAGRTVASLLSKLFSILYQAVAIAAVLLVLLCIIAIWFG